MHQHLIIGLQGTELAAHELDWLRRKPPLGVILFARNCRDAAQVAALVDSVRQATGQATWAAIDEEGGRVTRMDWPPFSSRRHAADYRVLHAGKMDAAEEAVYLDSLQIGRGLAELGLTHNCAPVLDVFHSEGHGIIGRRAYGDDGETVSRLGAACMRGLHDAGIEAVGKHFPGHGRADADSHVAAPRVAASLTTILREAEPFRRLIGQGLRHVMTAHVVYESTPGDARHAATFSPFWLKKVLREEFSFRGRIWSDDLCMAGAGGDVAAAAKSALAAGCDVLPVCQPEGVRAVMNA